MESLSRPTREQALDELIAKALDKHKRIKIVGDRERGYGVAVLPYDKPAFGAHGRTPSEALRTALDSGGA